MGLVKFFSRMGRTGQSFCISQDQGEEFGRLLLGVCTIVLNFFRNGNGYRIGLTSFNNGHD